METSNKTASDILLEAADLLEEEGKCGRGGFFTKTGEGCQMCAHGAIAWCGDPEVRASIAAGKTRGLVKFYVPGEIASEQRIRDHYGEVGLAHLKADRIGLTFNYNDNERTTKQDVIDKLRQAARS